MGTWIGTSGWSYDHWQDVLYHGCPPAQRLGVYAAEFTTVELNASFYRWPRDATFSSWQRRLPAGFRMSVKAPRALTHARRLYAPEYWVGRIAAAWDRLYDKRGSLLVQLPPGMERDDARLDYFLGLLPWWLPVAVEFRHPSCERGRVRPPGTASRGVRGDVRSRVAVCAPRDRAHGLRPAARA